MEIINNNNNYKMDFSDLKMELNKLDSTYNDELFDYISNLSHQKLIKVISVISQIRKRKFKRGKRLLGSLSKALPEELFNTIIDLENNPKFKLAIKTQGILALRVSEVVTIQVSDIDFIENKIIIKNHKCDTIDELPIQETLANELKQYIKKYKKQIEFKNNYIFFGSKKNHITKDSLRNKIRKLINLTGMQKKYVSSIDGRKLNLYSSHSLRAYGITKFYNVCGGDIILASMYARHKDIKDTQLYVDRSYKDMKKVIQNY